MENEITEYTDLDYTIDKPSRNTSSYPLIAGILLLIGGFISILLWVPVIIMDISIFETVVDISQFQQIDPSFTIEDVKIFMTNCAIIGIIISVFPILAGLISIKKKLWGISLAGSIIGLTMFIPSIIGGVLSLVAMILLFLSKKEFK
jgi:hypothetical protein